MPTPIPTVSVVVPCFNSRRYVRRALDSVFAQTEPLLELICVDDGSEDGTVDELKDIAEQSPIPMRVIRLGRNCGACTARNAGMDVAHGDYVQFLDSDDLLYPDKIAHQLRLISRQSNPIDLVAADCLYHYVDGSAHPRRWPRPLEVRVCVDRRDPFHGLVTSRLGRTSSNLWRADTLRRVRGFNARMRTSNEYELMFRLLQAGAVVIADPAAKTILYRRSDSLSRSPSGRTAFYKCSIDLRLDILRYMERQGIATTSLRHIVYGNILNSIRGMWTYDPQAAEDLYTDLLPPGFIPNRETAGRGYRVMLRTLGFARAQRVARALGRSP